MAIHLASFSLTHRAHPHSALSPHYITLQSLPLRSCSGAAVASSNGGNGGEILVERLSGHLPLEIMELDVQKFEHRQSEQHPRNLQTKRLLLKLSSNSNSSLWKVRGTVPQTGLEVTYGTARGPPTAQAHRESTQRCPHGSDPPWFR
ncbi:hypothetical protein Taro_012848, partial [Colocasia esculenta]|nr:hypothetical protein [Colocasia esculenta]